MKFRAPQGCSVVSVDGVEYAVDADGLVDAPGELGGAILEHGFTLAEDVVAPSRAAEPDAESALEDEGGDSTRGRRKR